MAGKHSTWPVGDGWKRVIAWAGVISVHAAMFVFLTIPSAQYPEHAQSHTRARVKRMDGSALRVRLIHVSPRKASTGDVSPRKSRKRNRLPVVERHTRPRERAQTDDAARTGRKEHVNSLDLSVLDAEEKQFVVGRDWSTGKAGRPNVRLPGGNAIPGAPHFEMVDPRSQGIAGVIHFIGSLTGAVDPHCLDLDAWQAMTVKERVAHGVSFDDIQHIKDNYNCALLRRRR